MRKNLKLHKNEIKIKLALIVVTPYAIRKPVRNQDEPVRNQSETVMNQDDIYTNAAAGAAASSAALVLISAFAVVTIVAAAAAAAPAAALVSEENCVWTLRISCFVFINLILHAGVASHNNIPTQEVRILRESFEFCDVSQSAKKNKNLNQII